MHEAGLTGPKTARKSLIIDGCFGIHVKGGTMASGLTPNELRRLQEFAAAGRRGRIVNAGSRLGLANLITRRYLTERAVSAYSVLYVITDRGRRVLAEADAEAGSKMRDTASLPNVEQYPNKGHRHDGQR
jgi:hypothetical protein